MTRGADYVAKLLIYRGESLLDERELTEQTLKIGRGAQNDIVLEDPGKGVSREHAELRFEGGRYTLVDRQSQNGIWVSGVRVPSVVLDRDVVATVGPYRLAVKAEVVSVAPAGLEAVPILDVPVAIPIDEARAMAVPPPVADLAPSESPSAELPSAALPAVEPPADSAPPPESAAAPFDLNDLAPAPKPSPVPPPPPAPPVVTGTGSSQRLPRVPPAPKPQPSVDARVVGMAAAALILVALSGYVGYRLMHRRPPPGPTFDVTIAQSLVNSGRCAEALQTQINPALTRQPNDETWRKLRDQCTAPPPTTVPPTTTSVPPVPSVAELLDEADKQIAAKDCQAALTGINAAIAQEPDNDRAKSLLAKANACAKPAQTTSSVPAVVDPSKGELPRLKGESDKDHKDREAKAKQNLGDAIVLIQSRKYLAARKMLDDLANDVPPNFLDLAQRRDELAKAMQTDARNALTNAQAIDRAVTEKAEEYDTAAGFYRRAHELDPTIQVDAAIARLNEKRVAVGTDKCKRGMAAFALGNNASAQPLLQDAVKLLTVSPSDSCYAEARQALQRIPK